MRLHKSLLCLAATGVLWLGAGAALADDKPPTAAGPGAEFCKQHPEKCEALKARCKEHPEKCEQFKKKAEERRAFCEKNPEKCKEQRARMQKKKEEIEAQCKKDPEHCDEIKQQARAKFKKRHGIPEDTEKGEKGAE